MNRLVSGSMLVLACSACADSAPRDDGGGHLRFAGLGTCSASGNDDGQFPSDSDRVVIEVSGGSLSEPVRAQAAASEATAEGEIVFPDIPVGNQYLVRAAACSGTTTKWAGQTAGVNVGEFSKSFPSIFLTPIDSVTCTGNAGSTASARELTKPRAFAALAATGQVAYVLGGGETFATDTRTLTATQTIDRYDVTTGEIRAETAVLTGPRAGAIARPLAGDRVRVVGGAARILIGSAGKPGVFASKDDFTTCASEIFDPATGASTVEVGTPLAPLASLAVLPSGAIVAVGGAGELAGFYSEALAILEGGGDDRGVVPGGARFGATVVPLGGDDVLVLGGNIDADLAHAGVLVDAGLDADSASTAITVTGLVDVPYAASGAVIGNAGGAVQVLIVGGGTIQAGGNFGATSITAARALVVTVDVTAQTANAVPVDFSALNAGLLTRAFGTLAVLPGGDVVYFGGYTAFTNVPAICDTPTDCIQGAILRMRIADPGGSPTASSSGNALTLNGGPLGSAAVTLSDGSWLVTGGVDSILSSSIAKAPGLVRYTSFDPDLCTTVAPDGQ